MAATWTPKFEATGNLRLPLFGGLLYSYAAGTTTPLPTFTNAAGTTANPNPVQLDASGRADVWLTPNTAYKLVLKDRFGDTIWTTDNFSVSDPLGLTAGSLANNLATGDGSLIGYKGAGNNTLTRTVKSRFDEMPSITDYKNADGTRVSVDVADNLTGIQAAINDNAAGDLFFPAGRFRINGELQVLNNLRMHGAGRRQTNIINTNPGFVHTMKITGLTTDGGGTPIAYGQVGVLQDIGFIQSSNTAAAVRFTKNAHMWSVDRLLFLSLLGGAMQFDTQTWDTFINDIDILSCAQDKTLDPSVGAALIVKDGCNNLHFTGFRCEGPQNAGVYWADSQGYIDGGKIDRGFTGAPNRAGMIVPNGYLNIRDFYIGGSIATPAMRITGKSEVTYTGGNLDGGSDIPGLIELAFTRSHDSTGIESLSHFRPKTGSFSMRGVEVAGRHPSVAGKARSIITSSTPSNVYFSNRAVTSSDANQLYLAGISPTRNNWCDGCCIVNVATNDKAIVSVSYSTGEIRLGGNYASLFPVNSVVRIDYFMDPREFVEVDGVRLLDDITAYEIAGSGLVSAAAYQDANKYTVVSVNTAAGFVQDGFAVSRGTGICYSLAGVAGNQLYIAGDVAAGLPANTVLDAVACGGGYPVRVDGDMYVWRQGLTRRVVPSAPLLAEGRGLRSVIVAKDGVAY